MVAIEKVIRLNAKTSHQPVCKPARSTAPQPLMTNIEIDIASKDAKLIRAIGLGGATLRALASYRCPA
jgi:hypothetical protein